MKPARNCAAGLFALLLLSAWSQAGLTAALGETANRGIAAAPTVIQNEETGTWRYESDSLCVSITRFTDDTVPLIWYEADLRCSPDAPLNCVLSAAQHPGRGLKKPDVIAQENNLVYAQTDDFFGDRASSKKLKTGVIIRGGALLYDRVYHGKGKPFPPLDTLAIFPDGTLETFLAGTYSGEQYIAMGALDVVSFGPVLIADGVIDPRLPTDYADHEPRSVIGMVTPYHYVGIVVEGRHDGSAGCGLQRLAQRMLELGVTEALNLDGGQTAAMVFMGQQLNQTGRYKHRASVRSVSGVLGIKDATSQTP